MRHVKLSVLILVSLTLAFGSTFASDTPGLSNRTTPRDGGAQGSTTMISKTEGCNLIDFEGIGDLGPIGVVAGPVNVTFGTSWLGVIDGDAGGSGNFANEPSENTAAFFLDLDDISISLDTPVQFVQFFYSAAGPSLPVTVTAFDSNNVMVDQAIGNTIGRSSDGALCSGDPNGVFCLWDTITLTAAVDNITSIQIIGQGDLVNLFAIDNLQFCTEEQDLVYCCRDDLSCVQTTAANCAAAGGVEVLTCDNVDCEAVPTDKSTWGSIKGSYR